QARARREKIDREAEFYGAMDGAAKFVRWDAVAAILIPFINILGGFVIGVAQRGMSFPDAIKTYTLLSVGDGLVSQIPALIVSTAAGVIITRASSESHLGIDIHNQIMARPKALVITSLVLYFFGFTPGLPTMPFFVLATLVGMMAIGARRQIAEAEKAEQVEKEEERRPRDLNSQIEEFLQVDPLELEIGYGLIPLVDADQGGDLLGRITEIRKQCALEIGIIVPPIRIRDNIQLNNTEYVIKIRGVDVARGEVFVGRFMALDPGTVTEKVEGTHTREQVFGLEAIWIGEEQKEAAEANGYTVVEASAVLATHLMETLKRHAHEILSRQDVQTL
ncbi:MAG TPA: flagellar biosynthesis protein FlhA, partial [Candidatus Glassbacteria bacterium]|nr:flagellar biosynthesis protein FlhA [Candidatus Glassbacteria bacterium]